jgi:hypothetical protein
MVRESFLEEISMVHKVEEIKSREEKAQEDIDALKEKLKLLELEQQKQGLEQETKQKEFWTKHKRIRESIQSLKSSIGETQRFVKTKVSPAVASGLRGAYREYKKRPVVKEEDFKF